MGATADAALAAGGKVVGVIPEALLALEQVHTGLSELHVVDSMHARKAKMASLVDAFVALPGGMGTLEELLEIATWSKLGIHAKPCGVVNVDGYYDPLDSMLGHAVAENFMRAQDHDPGPLPHRPEAPARPARRVDPAEESDDRQTARHLGAVAWSIASRTRSRERQLSEWGEPTAPVVPGG